MTQRPRVRRGPTLSIDNEVTRRIRQHARAHMKTEVCGVLIGAMTNGEVKVQASIEALNAAQAGTHVTFTQDAWEAIYKVKDESWPDDRIVGWYHSHPGFGVFLSEHDTFIHQNFFSSPDQVAWVYDPHTDEEGCFGWIDGGLHRLPNIAILDNNGDGVEHTPKESSSSFDEMEEDETIRVRPVPPPAPPAPWLRWGVTALSYLTALLLGFVVSWVLFPHYVAVDPATGVPIEIEIEQIKQEIQAAQDGKTPPSAAPSANPPANPPGNPSPGAPPASSKPAPPSESRKTP
jgi:proteasome lid subunit RPN8/RPN11